MIQGEGERVEEREKEKWDIARERMNALVQYQPPYRPSGTPLWPTGTLSFKLRSASERPRIPEPRVTVNTTSTYRRLICPEFRESLKFRYGGAVEWSGTEGGRDEMIQGEGERVEEREKEKWDIARERMNALVQYQPPYRPSGTPLWPTGTLSFKLRSASERPRIPEPRVTVNTTSTYRRLICPEFRESLKFRYGGAVEWSGTEGGRDEMIQGEGERVEEREKEKWDIARERMNALVQYQPPYRPSGTPLWPTGTLSFKLRSASERPRIPEPRVTVNTTSTYRRLICPEFRESLKFRYGGAVEWSGTEGGRDEMIQGEGERVEEREKEKWDIARERMNALVQYQPPYRPSGTPLWPTGTLSFKLRSASERPRIPEPRVTVNTTSTYRRLI
jgi:hypothetical protein